jgi:hypothetical protein
MTPKAVLVGFAICASFFGARFQTPSDPRELEIMTNLWSEALADIPDELGVAAFKQYGAREDHPPTPADIRRMASPPSLPGAGVAWSEALEVARTHGYCEGNVPAMNSPEARAAAIAVGWSALCFASSERDLSFTRTHFFRIYDDLVARAEREQQLVQLEGHFPAGLLPRLKEIE